MAKVQSALSALGDWGLLKVLLLFSVQLCQHYENISVNCTVVQYAC